MFAFEVDGAPLLVAGRPTELSPEAKQPPSAAFDASHVRTHECMFI